MFKIQLIFGLLYLLGLPIYSQELNTETEHKEDLATYIEDFCQNRGRAFVRVQSKVVIDCLSADTLWKIDYADNWKEALADSMFYVIYDNYLGDQKSAPLSGIVLVQEDADDYRNMVQLKHLVKYYKLPIRLKILENYGPRSTPKNLEIDLGKRKFFLFQD